MRAFRQFRSDIRNPHFWKGARRGFIIGHLVGLPILLAVLVLL